MTGIGESDRDCYQFVIPNMGERGSRATWAFWHGLPGEPIYMRLTG